MGSVDKLVWLDPRLLWAELVRIFNMFDITPETWIGMPLDERRKEIDRACEAYATRNNRDEAISFLAKLTPTPQSSLFGVWLMTQFDGADAKWVHILTMTTVFCEDLILACDIQRYGCPKTPKVQDEALLRILDWQKQAKKILDALYIKADESEFQVPPKCQECGLCVEAEE